MREINYISGTVVKLIILISGVISAPNINNGPTVHNQEPESLLNCTTSQEYQNLSAFGFNSHSVPYNDSACLAFKMFQEMDLVQQFHIPVEKLSRFIENSLNGYRDVPYHNWKHGFAVQHFTFAVLKNCKFIEDNCITPLEGLALLTAALCHDMDHPGTNSQFQLATNSSIAQAYRSQGSILERHHIEKTFNLLKDPKNNFVENLSENDHEQFTELVKQIILATDLTTHFKTFPEEEIMAREGLNRTSEHHRQLLRSIVISSADLSHSTTNWATAREIAKSIFIEFFYQQHEEKLLGLVPDKMLDINDLVERQIKFITEVVKPLFRVLATVCPKAQESVNSLENNLKHWQGATPKKICMQRPSGGPDLCLII